jgi:hypothetical protein
VSDRVVLATEDRFEVISLDLLPDLTARRIGFA